MSRIYDALKQASRAQRGANADPAQEELDSLGIDGLGSLVSSTPVSSTPVSTANGLSTVETLSVDPWVISADRLPNRRIAQNGFLGKIAKIVVDQGARVIPNATQPIIVEHYRRLRTKIMQQHGIKPFRSLVVTSPGPEEGKSVTVMNLAFSFAMLPSFKVAVVDGDLRRGTLGKWLGLTDQPGLSNLIDGSATLAEVVVKSDEIPVHFIVSGNSKLPAAELLHSSQLGDHFRTMTEQFDLVLVDSPPVNLITDTQLLAANCDAVLLVARAFRTTRKALEKAAQDLQPFRMIGSVLNGGAGAHLYRGYGGYY